MRYDFSKLGVFSRFCQNCRDLRCLFLIQCASFTHTMQCSGKRRYYRRFLNNVGVNDGCLLNNELAKYRRLLNNVGAMHRRLLNIVWTNDGRLLNNVWANDGRLVNNVGANDLGGTVGRPLDIYT